MILIAILSFTMVYTGGENMYEDLFYQRLIELRTKKGVSARDMSLSIGQNAGYINGLENRKGLPSMAVFFYICDFLEVTPSEFFKVDIEEPQKLKELYEEIKSFDSERLELLARLIKYMR